MNFAAFDFWIYLGSALACSAFILLLVGWLAPQHSAAVAKWCFIGTSLYLLASQSMVTLVAFLWVVLLGWAAMVATKRCRPGATRSVLFVALIIAQTLPLIYYKYWGFICHDILHLNWPIPHGIIPMGLSFHTFQTIAVCLDSRPQAERLPRFVDYMNFSSFFPQIVAGPIERRDDLLPQIEKIKLRPCMEFVPRALGWIVLGLFYKTVIADNLAAILDISQLALGNAWQVWLEAIIFGVRIYFDFAGYSFIAVGLAYLFGVTLTLNFVSPYLSKDIREFWRRWHTTLSRWLKDYIYFPLGGSRTKRWAFNILVVFLVSGIWHGAGWNFVIWGLLHGIAVALATWGKPLPLPAWIRSGATMIFVAFTWLFFMETNTTALLQKVTTLFTPGAYWNNPFQSLESLLPTTSDAANLLFICALAAACIFLEWLSLRRDEPYGLLRRFRVSMVLVPLIVFLAPMKESTFIYFNF